MHPEVVIFPSRTTPILPEWKSIIYDYNIVSHFRFGYSDSFEEMRWNERAISLCSYIYRRFNKSSLNRDRNWHDSENGHFWCVHRWNRFSCRLVSFLGNPCFWSSILNFWKRFPIHRTDYDSRLVGDGTISDCREPLSKMYIVISWLFYINCFPRILTFKSFLRTCRHCSKHSKSVR
jgi:hypothetical protein